MNRVTFTDPATGNTYVWPINPNYDAVPQATGKQRQIERTSNTGNIGLVRQQGDDGPFIIHWEPFVYSEDHEQQLWTWYMLCKTQSIYLTDFNAEQFEGQIITLQRQQIGAMRGPGDTNERGFYCKYIFEFEVWAFITGPLAAAGVLP